MGAFLRQNRILEFVLVIGLAIVFLAVLMIFLGSNAQAGDIYVDDDNVGGPWDGSMANPYQNITSALANSNPTDNIYVWDGSYNENITVDKELAIIGNGSATTKIDGFGTMNNIINITTEGVEITGFNITESGLWYGIWANVGGFNIHNNTFDTQNYAIYMDIYRIFSGSSVIGDIIVDNNEVIGTDGFYFYISYEKPLMGSNLIFNQTVITNNKLYNTDTGIILYRYKMRDVSGGSVIWGDITVNDNFVNCNSDNGIFFWGWLVNMTDVDMNIGSIDILRNNITSSSTGIEIVAWDTIDLFGTTVASIGDTLINNNTIVSQYYNGITLYSSYLFFLYDSASVTTGDFFIYSNNITTASPIGQEGICVYIIGVGQFMYNDSSVNFGNMYIDSNKVNSNNHGIYISYEDSFGTDTYNNTFVNAGNLRVTNNEVLSANHSIYVSLNRIGNSIYDYASSTLGNFIIDYNNLTCSGNGIKIQGQDIARNMHNDTMFSMGDFTVNNNTVNSTNNMGIDFDMQNCAHTMTQNATATFGNFLFNDNVVNSMDNGIYFYFYGSGYEMYGNSLVYFGHIQLNDNTITCNDSYAILVSNFNDLAFIIEGNSYFEMGDFEIKRNSIESNGSGIYFKELGFLGNYLTETSISVFGDFIIEDNTINASNEGIRIDAYDWGETLSGSASAMFGNFSVSNNIIESGSQGIFFQLDPAAYDMHDMSSFEMGSIRISNNTILSGKDPASVDSYGISFWSRTVGYYMHNGTQAIMGSILVNDNNVTVLFGTNADGINIYRISRYGTYMYDSASFTMNGNLEVCRNTVNTSNGEDGIFCSVYENGYYLYDDSTANFGNFMFNDNIINSTGNGLYIDAFQMCGSYVYNNSVASFGDIEINGNQIIAGSIPSGFSKGIYFYFYENCYDVFGNPQVYFGHVQINDNTITCYDTHGIYVDAFYEIGANYMQDNAYFEMGNFEVQRNWIDANESGLYIAELAMLGYEIQDNSSAVFGDFLFDANTIYAGADGIYINAFDWARTMTGNASATFGDLSVSNNIIDSQNQGIYLQLEYAGYDMHDQARFEMGALMVSNNTIISGQDPASVDSYGILFRSRYVGYEMYNETQAIVGPILVNENTVTVLFGTNSQAIYINWISDYGTNMYDTATFSMNGNIEVCRNTINTTNGDDGIFCDVYNLGNYLYGDNTATYGNFLFNDNTIIEAYNDGMHILVNVIGYYTYGNSSVTIGNVELNSNEMLFSNRIYFAGIDFRFYELGAKMYDGSIFNMGLIQMNDNTINNSNGLGLNIDGSRLGYQMYNSSSAYFGGFGFLRNNITSLDEGIYFDWLDNFASNLYDDAMVHFGNFFINNNIIITTRPVGTSDGIDVDHFRYVGYQMNDRSYAEFGNFEISGNEIIVNSSAKGIGIWLLNWACNMYDNASFVMGDFNFIDNTINAYDNGIYWEPEYFGAYMYGNSTAIIGNNFITGNEINVAEGYGLYAWWWYYFAYEMHNNSMCMVGDSVIMYNVINVTGGSGISGIYTGPYDSGENVYDSSTAIFGDYIVSYNTINTVDVHGILFSIYRVGYNMDGFASVTTGNISVSNNIINSTNGNGIYISDTYQNGNELYDNAKVTMGSIEFIGNHIEAGSNGITCDNNFYGFGSYMYDNSKFEMGDFNFLDNIITANYNGIYFEPYYFGAYMEDNSIAIIGNNFITGNEINVADGYGLYAWWWYWFAYEMYDNSTCTVGDSVIRNNVINVTGSGMYGIWTGPYDSGENVYGNITAIFGDYIVSHNTIIANNSYGIEFDIYQTGYEMYDNSNVTFGQFQIKDNNITTPYGAGLFVNFDTLAYNVYNNSYLSLDDIMISNNIISAQTIGLDIQYEDCGGLYHTSTAYLPGIQILGNWVDSAISAFNYTTINTPIHNDPGATQIWGDVIFEGNTFDGGLFGMALNWQDPNAGIPQPMFVINQCDIISGSANSTGLYLYNMDEFYIESLTIDSYDYGIFANNSNIWLMFNSTITNTPSSDMNLASGSYIAAVNCTFNQTSVNFEDDKSLLEVGWFLHVLVRTSAGIGIPDANVSVTNVYTTEVFNGTTNANGYVLFLIIWEYEENITGIIENYNNHTVSADKAGSFGFVEENMDISKLVIITFVDSEPPTIFDNNTDIAGTTGDVFSFLINASDNMGVSSVHVNYRLGTSGPFTNLTLTGSGPYWQSIVIPIDYVGVLEYYFDVNDVNDNWVSSAISQVPITDNDAPTNLDDTSDILATTGGSFTFTVNATDNIDVTQAHVVWWFGSGSSTNDTMTGVGPYTFLIPVPSDSLDTLHYYFAITDAVGNWLVGAQVDINVTDNDAPTFVSDDSDTTANVGIDFNFNADFTDNIGVTEAYVIYWFDSGAETNESMTGPSPFLKTITIPPGSGELHYYFKARDGEGNWNSSSQVDITITSVDNPPELVSDDSDTEATTGDSFEFEVAFTDDIGVSEVHVVYWFLEETPFNLTMSGTDTYTLTITISSDLLEPLHYYFTALDTGGNWYVGIQNDITVSDNDNPTDIIDNSQMTATTGDDFIFNISASDNIAVTEIEIFYWFGDDTPTSQTVTGSGLFTYSIAVPTDSNETLHYYLVVRDAAGNSEQSNQVDITVTDNDPGTISNDQSDDSGKEGEEFTFQIDASDNLGISQVRVAYWFGVDESQKSFLTLSLVNGSYEGSITPEGSGTLNYYFEVTDSSGNVLEDSQQSVQIASEPKGEEEEPTVLPWILVIIIIIVVLIFFFLIMKKGKGEEGLEAGDEKEPEVVDLEDGEDIAGDSEEGPGEEGDIEMGEEPEVEGEPEMDIEPDAEEISTEEKPIDENDKIIEEVSDKDET